jgi:hypothetical protein
MLGKFKKKSERGQAIIIIAAALVGMVAMVGLMTDGGMTLVEYARLKRGIDAASIAAAQQFRKGFDVNDLENAATEFLKLNQSDVVNVQVDTCQSDATMCTTPRRKLVRVTATRHVTFGFLRVIKINGTDITVSSVGEAASIDMMLAIDTSASMAFETDTSVGTNPNKSDPATATTPGDDPHACNSTADPAWRCEPLGTIKDVAIDFVDTMFFPYDRVGVVAFTEQWPGADRDTWLVLPLDDNDNAGVATTDVQNAIGSLKVYEPYDCPTAKGLCLNRDGTGKYIGQDCPAYRNTTPNDPSSCTSSNVGGALYMAGDQFSQPPIRKDSFWVVIALLGGPANATSPITGHVDGFCPDTTWSIPFCRDLDPSPFVANDPANRHSFPTVAVPSPYYDANDYAYDAADYVTSPVTGQGASLFSICVGSYCQNYPSADPASAEHLGQYMALSSGGPTANHGLYFYSADPSGLASVFKAISDNIFTRISQ